VGDLNRGKSGIENGPLMTLDTAPRTNKQVLIEGCPFMRERERAILERSANIFAFSTSSSRRCCEVSSDALLVSLQEAGSEMQSRFQT
jgi:hypothetical protein